MINIKPNKKINRKKLNEIEEKYNGRLPKEYIQFLEKYSGGEPEDNIIELPNTEIRSISVRLFFGICDERISDIFYNIDIYKGRIPINTIPIADVDGGNLLCMNLNSDGYGHIYYWDHDEELQYEIGEIGIKDLYYVASSFNELLNNIKPYNDEDIDISKHNIEIVYANYEFLKKHSSKTE